MQTVDWENFYIVCSLTELLELITIVVDLIVSKLGSILLVCKLIIKCMSLCMSDLQAVVSAGCLVCTCHYNKTLLLILL